jgi:hypothetical protein
MGMERRDEDLEELERKKVGRGSRKRESARIETRL